MLKQMVTSPLPCKGITYMFSTSSEPATPAEHPLDFPLTVRMKLMALAPQFYVTDKHNRHVAYVKQKLFKLKEDISIFANERQDQLLYTIKADRIIDFNASYSLQNAQTGQILGSIKRKGMRSLWKAAYRIYDTHDQLLYTVSEESAFIRFLDGLFSQLPILGLLSGYVFNPSYLVQDADGQTVLRMKKQPALFEGLFKMETFRPLLVQEQKRLMLSMMMVILLERYRG